jgi:alpha-N-arabinofuranosidase
MKKLWNSIVTLLVMSFAYGCQEKREQEITINMQQKGPELSESMYGIFFEEINHAGDGGLYAELI